MIELRARGLIFPTLQSGPRDGEGVLLLHGFPLTNREWSAQLAVLGAAGFSAVAPAQTRGQREPALVVVRDHHDGVVRPGAPDGRSQRARHARGIHRTGGPGAVGEVADRGDGVVRREVDHDLRAEIGGHRAPQRRRVGHQHADARRPE